MNLLKQNVKCFLLLVSLFTGFTAQAQFGTAPDFTVTDIDGEVINLYDILDEGIVVVLDVSATWCSSCWNFHQSHVLQDLHELYGPDGTNQVRVIYYEAGDNTALTTDAHLAGIGSATLGNWLSGSTYQFVNETLPYTLNLGVYAPQGFPTVNIIRPSDKEIVADTYNIYTLAGQENVINSLTGIQLGIVNQTSCTDGILNGSETGIDCGGPSCPPCVNSSKVKMKLLLEGAVQSDGYMSQTLLSNNLLPLQHPFAAAPYNYTGGESLLSYGDFPSTTVDWVLVEARSATNPSHIIETKAALLRRDGRLMDVDGTEGVSFENLNGSSAFNFVIYHRSHMAVMTNAPIAVPNALMFDFSTGISKAAGSEQQKVVNGNTVIYSGDFDGNGTINFLDFLDWFGNNNTLSQYLNADVDMNGTVNFLDFLKWFSNNNTLRNPDI